jgi:hypothetical protein
MNNSVTIYYANIAHIIEVVITNLKVIVLTNCIPFTVLHAAAKHG